MNRLELIEKLMDKPKALVTHADMERIVNGFMEEIKNAVAAGDSVQLVGFGTFDARKRNGRMANNPQTGEKVWIEPKKVPVFKAGTAFKNIVNK